MADVVEKNDFILISFEGKLAAGHVFEKTPANSPLLIVAGGSHVLPALDAAILGSLVGEHKHLTLLAANAFGPRQEQLLRMLPLARFQQSGITPVAGQSVELDGMRARILSVNGGRVRVDFNHELAGKDVEYSFTVEKRFTTPTEKLRAALENVLGLKEPAFTLEGKSAVVKIGPNVRKDAEYFLAKTRVVNLILSHVPAVTSLEFDEVFDSSSLPAAPKG